MTRSRTLALLAAATLLLGACSGNKEKSQGDVEDDVHDQMIDPGFVSHPDAEPIPLEEDQAQAMADCVGAGLFDPEQFTKDEREAAANSFDADPPDPDLVVKVEDLINGCYETEVEAGPSADQGSDEDSGDSDSDDEATTTTEG